ncbi:hypothetical protein KW443_09230 [Vibrio fluvialis]|nr:hypothetical protein [Vibrio fluvialis]MBY7999985.1 hypothetical protein [Vibrio fluvialis]
MVVPWSLYGAMRFWFGCYVVSDRFDELSKSRFVMGGFAVCVVSALGYMVIVKHMPMHMFRP